MLRLLDILDEQVVIEDRARWRPRRTHNPSSASAWLPCEACGGHGMVECDGDGGRTVKPCEACANELGAPKPGLVLVGECMRRCWLEWKAATPTNPNDATGILKTKMGHAHETITLDYIGRGIYLWRQIPVRYRFEGLDFDMHGFADAGFWSPDERFGVCVENKSTYSWGMGKARNGIVPEDVFLQGCCYVFGLPNTLPLEGGWRWCKFLYGSRDNMDRRELDRPIAPDEAAENMVRIVARWKELEGYLAENQAPPAEYRHRGTKGDWSHWKCRIAPLKRDGSINKKEDGYCPYRKLCHDIEEGNDQWRSTSAVPCSPAQG